MFWMLSSFSVFLHNVYLPNSVHLRLANYISCYLLKHVIVHRNCSFRTCGIAGCHKSFHALSAFKCHVSRSQNADAATQTQIFFAKYLKFWLSGFVTQWIQYYLCLFLCNETKMLKRYFVALLAYCICLLDVSVCLRAVEPQILCAIYCLLAVA